jgi:Protein of unknown function (DUF642)
MNKRFFYLALAGSIVLTACAPPSTGSLPGAAGSPTLGLHLGAMPMTDLITNGSFEQPTAPSGSYLTFSTGQTFDGWTVVGTDGNVSLISDTFTYGGYTLPAGCDHQWLDLTGTSDSATGVQQKIATVKGTTYDLSFQVGNAYAPSGNIGKTSTVLVYVNGKKIYKAKNKKGKGLTRQVWKQFSTTFFAKSTAAKIKFVNGDPASDTDNGLDCVSVTPASH